MDQSTLASAVEAVLFTLGEAVERARLTAAFEIDEEELDGAVSFLQEKYSNPSSGLKLLCLEDCLQLCTKEEMFSYLVKVVKQPKRQNISEAVLETLSIIAYKQPVTRLEIEKIRGVSSEHAVSRLLELGLIEEAGRLEAPGRPILFQTSMEFLRSFGLESLEDLPQIDPELLERFREEAEEMVPGERSVKADSSANTSGEAAETNGTSEEANGESEETNGGSAETNGTSFEANGASNDSKDPSDEPFILGDTVMTVDEE